jgi:hypothetical protein
LSPGKQGIWSDASKKWKGEDIQTSTNGVTKSNVVAKEIEADDQVNGTPSSVGKVDGVEVTQMQVPA